LFENDVQSSAAELAVAKCLGRYWTPASEDPGAIPGDVGASVQVRWTARHDGGLLLHHGDNDEHPFVLVTGRIPRFMIAGWLWARDGKRAEFWRDDLPRPTFLVPQRVLRPFPKRTHHPTKETIS
jgi:hypothetical protein